MKRSFKQSKLVLMFVLVFAVALCLFSGIANYSKTEAVNASSAGTVYTGSCYTLKYEGNEVTLLVNPYKVKNLSKAEILDIKTQVAKIVYKVVTDDVDFTKPVSVGVNESNIAKANQMLVYTVDITSLTTPLCAQLDSIETINDDFINGDKFDLLIKYYVDNYLDKLMTTYPSLNLTQACLLVGKDLYDAVKAKAETVYDTEWTITVDNDIQAKVSNLMTAVKTLKEASSKVQLSLQDVIEVVNLVEDSAQVQAVINDIDVKDDLNDIITNASNEDITDFLTEVDVDTIIDVVENCNVLDHDDVKDIISNIGVDNLVKIADEVGMDKVKDLANTVNITKDDIMDVIESNVSSISLSTIKNLVKSFKIDGNVVYTNGEFVMGGIKAVIKDLPQLYEIAEWQDDEFKVSWDLEAETSFGTVEFTLTIGLEGNMQPIRTVVGYLSDMIEFQKIGDTYYITINTDAKIAKMYKTLANTKFASNEFKQRFFGDENLTVAELYEVFNATSLQDYLDLLKQLNYKGLVESFTNPDKLNEYLGTTRFNDYNIEKYIDKLIYYANKAEAFTYERFKSILSTYVDISRVESFKINKLYNKALQVFDIFTPDNISAAMLKEFADPNSSYTNEEFNNWVNSLIVYEERFNKIKAYVTKLYNKISPDAKSKCLDDYYLGNSEWEYTKFVVVEDVLKIFSSESYDLNDILSVFVDKLPQESEVVVHITTENVHRVEFVYGDKTQVGFLALDSNLADYYPVTEVGGYAVTKWCDANGHTYETMPNEDIVLYAICNYDLTVSPDVTKVYDGQEETLSVTVDPVGTYTYQWLKDGVEIVGATESTYTVKNVSDSGVYTCEVSTLYDLKESDPINVEITKATYDMSNVEFNDVLAVYDGQEHVAEITGTLPDGVTVSYTTNKLTNVGLATAVATFTIADPDNYNEVLPMEAGIEITKADITTCTFAGVEEEYEVTGSAIAPVVTVTFGSTVLVENTDYTVTYENNTAIGFATVKVVGMNNFAGTKTIEFEITGKSLTNAVVEGVEASYVFTGSAIEPTFTVKVDGELLVNDVDYTVTYTNNINAGTATITINAKSVNYIDSYTVSFDITPKQLTNPSVVVDPQTFTYDGTAKEPTITVKDGATELVKGTDYTITFTNNVNVGTAKATIEGLGNYSFSTYEEYEIHAKAASELTVSGFEASYEYTGSAIEPTLVVKDGATELVKDVDYKVTVTNNTNTGTVTITVTGIGNYTGTTTATFEITAKVLSNPTVTLDSTSEVFTGSAIDVTATVYDGQTLLVAGTDYKVTCTNNVNVGTANAKVEGIGNYSFTANAQYEITAYNMNGALITISGVNASYTYTGSEITPDFTVAMGSYAMTKDTDYTVSFENNKNAGTATITLNGVGNFTGTKTITFTIDQLSIANAVISGFEASYVYTGSAFTPAVIVKLNDNTLVLTTDYTVEYTKNTNIGTATITVTGCGNYTGTATATFEIVLCDIATATVSDLDASYTYTGSEVEPEITVKYGATKLVKGTDYTLAYANNVNVGTATITITGKGIYTGTKEVTFAIAAKSVSDVTVTGLDASYPYAGAAIEPTVTVKDGEVTLVKGTDYTVTYANNNASGTATITINGCGNYTGTKSVDFLITKNVNELAFSGVEAEYVYTGSEITPVVTVKDGATTLVKDVDYTVSYQNNVQVGQAAITVTGLDKYFGTYTINFNIITIDLSTATVTGFEAYYTYTGSAIEPAVTVKVGANTLAKGTDYTVTYANNVAIGVATITVKGIGNYSGTKSVSFVIKSTGSHTSDNKEFTTNGVTVISKEALPDSYDLVVNDVTTKYQDTDVSAALKAKQEGNVNVAYDIKFNDNGVKANANGTFTVKMPIPEELWDKTIKVVHIADDGTVTDIDFEIEDHYVVFTVEHFSVYAIVEITSDVKVPWFVYLIIAILVLAVVALIITLIIPKKKNEGEENAEEASAEAEVETEEEAPAEEAAEETPAEEAVEETPAEEATEEEAPTEEQPAEEK